MLLLCGDGGEIGMICIAFSLGRGPVRFLVQQLEAKASWADAPRWSTVAGRCWNANVNIV